ncbi:M23 family metallopeptidase [Microbacterium sp.]|uniref:M23 family metallopeptidase n=1 Tax=Microbacterium sp. TaxID=51671 RepID=UPI0039E37C12
MAEQFDSSIDAPETGRTGDAVSLRSRGTVQRVDAETPAVRTTALSGARAPRRPKHAVHPLRRLLTVTAVAGLVATVAIPAFAAVRGTSAEAVTLQQVAASDAQSLVVASEAEPGTLERGGYSATTPEEIAAKKAEEAAKAALAARLAAGGETASLSSDLPLVLAGSGSVRRPLPYFDNFGTPYAGHKGVDYMVARGTPIYAVADGVVVASSEEGPGWGVYVKIQHNIGGQDVTTLYAHMLYGSRRVSVGDTVTAGQLIGQVSDTGRAYGTHLHLEVVVNGTYVNGESWLTANAG